jgi:hypothetical protein
MLCYRDWKKTSGKPDEHIVVLKKAVIQAAAMSKAILEQEIGLNATYAAGASSAIGS